MDGQEENPKKRKRKPSKAANRARKRRFYHRKKETDPEWMERERQRLRELRRRTPQQKRKNREYMHRYYREKKASDPTFMEKNRERWRKYMQRKKARLRAEAENLLESAVAIASGKPLEAPQKPVPPSPVQDTMPPWFGAWRACRDDPMLFATGVLGLLPPGAPNPDGMPQLEPWQAQALAAVGVHDRVSIRSGHGVGKTAFVSIVVLWYLLTRSDCKIPIAANSENQLRDTVWPEIRKWHRMLPDPLQDMLEITSERVVIKHHPDEAFAVRRTASKDTPEALQGFHAKNLFFILEEASGIPDVVMDVALGALSTPGAKILCLGNPTRASGFFYDTHHVLRSRWYTIKVSSKDVPRARGHIEDILLRYGEESNTYKIRVLGEFPTSDEETVIPLELVTAAVGREVVKRDVWPVWGLDVARFGGDRTALAKRQGNTLLEPVIFWRNLDLFQTIGRLQQEYEKTPPDMRPREILIDVIGLGAGVLDGAMHNGLPVRGVNVSESASVKLRYQRLRDELWFLGRDWFLARDCCIPKDDDLIQELTVALYDYGIGGKLVVESKKDMKQRLRRSPDLADAFLLTLTSPDIPREVIRARRSQRRRGSPWAS